MIGKIIVLCFIGLMVFVVGLVMGISIEEEIQKERERRDKKSREED